MAYWVLKVILTPLLRCLYRLDVDGRGNIPQHGPLIIASNHQSFIDSIFIPLVVPRRVTFIAKAEYFENRRTAWFFRSVGQIPVKRGDGSAGERALDSAREVLDAGGVLGIYPEGTRSPDGRLYKGHTGVARLALSTASPVVPMSLTGTAAVQPIGSLRPRPFRRVSVRLGAPMAWPGLDPEDAGTLRRVTDEIMHAIGSLSGQDLVDEYAKRGRPSHHAAAAGSTVRTVPGPAAVGTVLHAAVDVTERGQAAAGLAGRPTVDEVLGSRPAP